MARSFLQEQQQWRAQKEEEALNNSVLDTATAARFSTAAALEARGRTGDGCAPATPEQKTILGDFATSARNMQCFCVSHYARRLSCVVHISIVVTEGECRRGSQITALLHLHIRTSHFALADYSMGRFLHIFSGDGVALSFLHCRDTVSMLPV